MAKAKRKSGGIAPQEYELVPIGSIQPHPRNVNDGDVGAIVQSIRANQFFGACLVQKSTGNILAGKHRWLAARECELEIVPVIWADVDDETALRMVLVDNRSCRLGHDDPLKLSEVLQEIMSNAGTLEGTGFTGDDLDEIIAELGNGILGDEPEGEDEAAAPRVSLADRFIVPPFSVLDARQGYWQERKRAWLALGIQPEIGRGDVMPSGANSVYSGSTEWGVSGTESGGHPPAVERSRQ